MTHKEKIVRISVALILSYVLTSYTIVYIFVGKAPHINQRFLISLPTKIINFVRSVTTASKLEKNPPVYTSPNVQFPFFSYAPSPTLIAPTPIISSTHLPTRIPTVIYVRATPTTTPVAPLEVKLSCPTFSENTYSSLSIISKATAHPETQADINMNLREYNVINEKLSLIDSAPSADDDPKAPQLFTLFRDKRAPLVTATYRVNNWDWNSNSRGGPIIQPKVTLVALAAKPGERFLLPQSGYSIGSGKQALVLYATKNFITLKYTREDNVVVGYTIHLGNICVDPHLLKLYNSLHASGRSQLPALAGGETVGTIQSNYIMVAIRDTGTFMDPRIRKDWWIGY